MSFIECKNLRVENITVKDAQQMHLTFQKCMNVEARNLLITAPKESPNTDGIHVTRTQNIKIINSVISTGICIYVHDDYNLRTNALGYSIMTIKTNKPSYSIIIRNVGLYPQRFPIKISSREIIIRYSSL